jgi:hypothetical protein
VFYFPQIAIYFIILSFSVQIILIFFINHVLKFKYQSIGLKIKYKISCDWLGKYKALPGGIPVQRSSAACVWF